MERTLLLVDDEENILSSLMRLLRRDGYRILRAGSGREGLEVLAQNTVGVIVSDQRMPEMSGVEFLSQVKALYPDTVRIVLSGYTDLNSVTDAINQGAIYRFLTKPWDDELLRANIEKAFRHYEMAAENERLTREIQDANGELSRINGELEKRVDEKTRQAVRNMKILQVSQEILENLPIAVIGVDEDNTIALANRKAHSLFDEAGMAPLPGCPAAERLPEPLAAALADTLRQRLDSRATCILPSNSTADIWCYPTGATSQSRGAVLVINDKKDSER